MQIFVVIFVFLSSLLHRLWITPKLDFGVDQMAIYELGKKFYETGVIPADGPKLVYTGESIPGGFQAVMAGLPLFLSRFAVNEFRLFNVPANAPVCVLSSVVKDDEAPTRFAVVALRFASTALILFFVVTINVFLLV